MPLFQISEGELVPFRRVLGSEDLYESEIEKLVWENLEEFTGEALFPVKRQAKLPTGGVADIVALDKSGRVVVIEIKRGIDRKQIAQCLEYAGWARKSNLDELAGLYSGGSNDFFADWSEFTELGTPAVVNPKPILYLIARDFEDRTESAFDYLAESGVPVHLVRVSMYEDDMGRRFADVEGEHEPEFAPATEESKTDHTKIDGRAIKIPDLLDAGLIVEGDELEWKRPKKGEVHRANITANGSIKIADGRAFSAPSRAANEAADVVSYDGWYAWNVVRLGKTLNDLRYDLLGISKEGG